MIEQHLSLLIVVLPLLAAPVVAVLPNGRLPWLVTTIITWAVFFLAWEQLGLVSSGVSFSYELGGWPPPWGIEYKIDATNARPSVESLCRVKIHLPAVIRLFTYS